MNTQDRSSRTRRQAGTALTRQFAVLSFIVIGLITVALCLVITHYLRKDLLEREWRITADYIRTEARHYLTSADFALPFSAIAQEHFRNFYAKTVRMPEIVRVKIYDTTAAVVWSDKPLLIGQRFLDNTHLLGALAGHTMVNLEMGEEKGENISEREEFSELVEVYVPIVFPEHTEVAGVVETYKAPTTVFTNIRQGQMVVIETALAGSALLYLSLFWIVRRAARRISEQQQALTQRSQELTASNQELQAVQTQLLEAERMAAIGEVVAAVAHGIRNPLANIRAVAQVATLDCKEEAGTRLVSRSLANIMAEVDRLENRLKELLQFARPAERQSEALDVNAVLCGTLRMMAGRLTRTGLVVEECLAPVLPPTLGDAVLFEQIFMSLIGNAAEALPASGGVITLTTGTAPDKAGTVCVFVEIRDTGVGIPPEGLAKIFVPFYTTKSQGTGLGLAIAKKFTEAYGGTISVSSRPGEGAVFRVTFPAYMET
jgi:two-component system, NtrC family, sensor histidine kinase HydH